MHRDQRPGDRRGARNRRRASQLKRLIAGLVTVGILVAVGSCGADEPVAAPIMSPSARASDGAGLGSAATSGSQAGGGTGETAGSGTGATGNGTTGGRGNGPAGKGRKGNTGNGTTGNGGAGNGGADGGPLAAVDDPPGKVTCARLAEAISEGSLMKRGVVGRIVTAAGTADAPVADAAYRVETAYDAAVAAVGKPNEPDAIAAVAAAASEMSGVCADSGLKTVG